MGSYPDADGKEKKVLNIVQRTNSRAGYLCMLLIDITGHLEVLRRPDTESGQQ